MNEAIQNKINELALLIQAEVEKSSGPIFSGEDAYDVIDSYQVEDTLAAALGDLFEGK